MLSSLCSPASSTAPTTSPTHLLVPTSPTPQFSLAPITTPTTLLPHLPAPPVMSSTVSCAVCLTLYIGQTGCHLADQFTKHLRNIKFDNDIPAIVVCVWTVFAQNHEQEWIFSLYSFAPYSLNLLPIFISNQSYRNSHILPTFNCPSSATHPTLVNCLTQYPCYTHYYTNTNTHCSTSSTSHTIMHTPTPAHTLIHVLAPNIPNP